MVTATPPARQLVTGGDPDASIHIPSTREFDGRDFMTAPGLERVGLALIAKGAIDLKQEPHISFLWKRAGGKSGGNFVLGKCVKLSGLNAYFGEVDFVVWLAADHLEVMRPNAYVVEGLIFHELAHIEERWNEDEDGNQEWAGWGTRGHDLEAFKAEVERYGLYRPAIQAIAPAFQARLPFENRVATPGDVLTAALSEVAAQVNAGALDSLTASR